MLAVAALVLLRLGIGWQFFQEGIEKLQGDFSSAGFLGAAKGPLAGMYTGMLPDPDGRKRLEEDSTVEAWKVYADRAIAHYGFGDDSQEMAERAKLEEKRAAAKAQLTKKELTDQINRLNRKIEAIRKQDEDVQVILERSIERLNSYLAASEAEIKDYKLGLERRERNQREEIVEVASLRGQAAKIEADLKKDRAKLLGGIDALWDDYERAVTWLATDEQLEQYGKLPLSRPGEKVLGTSTVNKVIPWLDLSIGVLLILGLFTRLASVVGAVFLLSIILSQWPGAVGAQPTYYQFNLMLAMLVLAATGAGRYCGLDFFGSALMSRCCGSRSQTTSQE
ncbi:MAG: DoxX family membrane protein [Pirellulaceae bacterium]